MRGLTVVFVASIIALVGSQDQFASRGVRRRVVMTSRDELRPLLSVPSRRLKRLPMFRPRLSGSTGQILQLESENQPAKYLRTPRKKHISSNQLQKLLGEHFERDWMSETKPDVLEIQPTLDELDNYSVEGQGLRRDLQSLNITQELQKVTALRNDSNLIESVKTWLVQRSLCPIKFTWEHVGPMFWPAWIKKGECVNDHSHTCSWPAGMRCMPSEIRPIRLLRWYCRPEGIPRERRETDDEDPSLEDEEHASNPDLQEHPRTIVVGTEDEDDLPLMQRRLQPGKRRTRVRCQWLKVPYPITISCTCAC